MLLRVVLHLKSYWIIVLVDALTRMIEIESKAKYKEKQCSMIGIEK